MRNKLFRWLLAIWVTTLLAACGGGDDGDSPPVATKAKTTVLVYMVASNLIGNAQHTLRGLYEARVSKDVNVILQIGGANEDGLLDDELDLRELRRYRLVPDPDNQGKTWDLEPLPQAQQPAQASMSEPGTLRDFLKWGAEAFPADQFVVSMWDHGGGPIGGFGSDYALGGGKGMSVNEVRNALRDSGVHFELIGFDACLMSSLEVASMLAPYGNYLVASEDVTTGWNWTSLMNFLADQPSASGDQIGKNIVQHYDGPVGPVTGGFSAYAVTDLTRVGPVVKAMEQIAQRLQAGLQRDGLVTWLAIAAARREAQEFQTNIFSQFDLVDVRSWVGELAQQGLVDAPTLASFDAAYRDAVVSVDGRTDDVTGLMIYFPRYSTDITSLLDRYAAVDFSPTYQALVGAYADFAQSGQMPQIAVGPTQIVADAASAEVQALNGAPLYDEAFAALVEDGVAVSMQTASAAGTALRLADASVWPMVTGQLVTVLPGEDSSLLVIPVQVPKESDPTEYEDGMLWATRTADGRVVIRWFVSASAAAGTPAAAIALTPGTPYFPTQLDLASGELVPAATPITVPATGEWTVDTGRVTGAQYSVYMAAADLKGRLQASNVGAALP
ncbi:hypothetical protein FVQ98_01275 [Ottowia sp. GY511]|uniref:Clostripain-related cysteine peptidase n=1 Tax=Ottowia flava TaxID=2675430 RepID=A0ABW4KTV2_9BURK|nr:clostripain-related cysteine peptidase [Ottowia sp. GY511]TXK33536.1 hypothetical protein FVQ98_01275 [Ottowia sp. GY511]